MMATLGETAIVLKRLAAAYGQTVTADQARAYHAVVGGYARLELAAAATDVMSEQKFFPRPAELRAELLKRSKKGVTIVVRDACDERALWRMYDRGITDPGELSEEDVRSIYSVVEFEEMPA